MEKDLLFFGETGITVTSANHVANMAKEYYQHIEAELTGFSLFSNNVSIIGNNTTKCISKGINSNALSLFKDKLHDIGEAKSLIAWLRESIKAKEFLCDFITNIDNGEHPNEMAKVEEEIGMKKPEPYPKVMPLTENAYLANLSVKDRNRYLFLETLASTIGTFIHQKGEFSNARKELNKIVNNPTKFVENGQNSVIYEYTPTVTVEEVDDTFFDLQKDYREIQKELNGMKSKMLKAVQESQLESAEKNKTNLELYRNEYRIYKNAVEVYKKQELKKIQNMKIIIPDSLKPIYDKINSLSSKKKNNSETTKKINELIQ